MGRLEGGFKYKKNTLVFKVSFTDQGLESWIRIQIVKPDSQQALIAIVFILTQTGFGMMESI